MRLRYLSCWSPPVRGRGLKLGVAGRVHCEPMSPPVRGRGLKHNRINARNINTTVAPRAGARIETGPCPVIWPAPGVAPRAGARIETPDCRPCPQWPSVAPRAGARIETNSLMDQCMQTLVAPRAGARIDGVTSRNGNNRTLSDSRRLGKRRVGVNPSLSSGKAAQWRQNRVLLGID